MDVNIFDGTAEAVLSLWGSTNASACAWTPSYTVLLITNADFRNERRPRVSLKNETFVDVDSMMTDAYWLRGYAQRLTKKECVNQEFPEGG